MATKFTEQLVEADLKGEALPKAQTPDQQEELETYLACRDVIDEVANVKMADGWQNDVWARIEGEEAEVVTDVPLAQGTGVEPEGGEGPASESALDSEEAEHATADSDDANTPQGDEEAEGSSPVISLADERKKRGFSLPALLGGLAIAAAALLAVGVAFNGASEDSGQTDRSVNGETMAASEAPNEESDRTTNLAAAGPRTGEGFGEKAAEAEGERGLNQAAPQSAHGKSFTKRPGEAEARPSDTAAKDSSGSSSLSLDGDKGEMAEAEIPSAAPRGSGRAPNAPEMEGAMGDTMGSGHGFGGGGTRRGMDSRSDKKADAPREKKRSRRKGGWSGDDEFDDLGGMAGKPGGWGRQEPPKPRLTAGEVDDNKSFADFTQFLSERNKSHLEPMDVSERMFIRVLDADSKPIPNAKVSFAAQGRSVFTGTTYSDGWMLFHPKTVVGGTGVEGFEVTITHGQSQHAYQVNRGAKERWQVRLPETRALPQNAPLDIVFLLDTTSSMGDEIAQLQATITQIADEVSRLPSAPAVRFGLVLYRDDSDEYVSKVHGFETDVQRFKQLLAEVDASGGGDIPERLEVGLHHAVNDMAWNDNATRLVFLVADAPPHARAENQFSYAQDVQMAAAKGIKIYPVATTGLDDDGEYVFRQLAQFTMGRFIFLTHGAGGTQTVHDVKPGSFQPETLDRLIVRVVREELKGLDG